MTRLGETENKLKEAFSRSLNIPIDDIVDDLAYGSTPHWDSLAHMSLIAELENSFDIMIAIEDVIDMSSVRKAREIIGRHGISF